MREENVIRNTDMPRTRQSISKDLGRLGLQQGMTVIVHSSLSALGWVNGGAVTVIQALMDVMTESGTIVMPTHSGDYSDPALWGNPPVPEEWCTIIRETMPAFNLNSHLLEEWAQFRKFLESGQVQCEVHTQHIHLLHGEETQIIL